MLKTHLVTAETFYSLQCEGRSIGTPAVFLRLAGCNLLCQSKTWICDTIPVWQKGYATEFKDVLSMEYVEHLKNGAHLVITGGEPLMQQKAIEDYLIWFVREKEFMPFIEIETNGTILPSFNIRGAVKYWNVCPKLSNSGEPYEKRVKEEVLHCFSNLRQTIYKFVVDCEEDIVEILDAYSDHVPFEKIWLMPAGATREELDKVRMTVVQLALKYGFRYSERLHIVIWNQKTGV